MKSQIIKTTIFLILLFSSCLFLNSVSQTNDSKSDPINIYDQIVNPSSSQNMMSEGGNIVTSPVKKDELILFLPKLDNTLYANWSTDGEPKIWNITEDGPNFEIAPLDILLEAGLEKILKQSYEKENHFADVFIYKFMDFAGAYSAFTVLHKGEITKLKVGKNASESDSLVNFWKGNYFVDINTKSENDKIAKEFIVLSSQDISKNIKIEQLPPVVAIQLPALKRIPGSEKYCISKVCFEKYFLPVIPDFGSDIFNLTESGGLILAEYRASENPKDTEKITLILGRYTKNETAQSVLDALKEKFEKKKLENKDMDIDFDVGDSVLTVKIKKDNYTMLKHKGNLLGIVFGVTNKKSGIQVLNLIPWPVEITRQVEKMSDN